MDNPRVIEAARLHWLLKELVSGSWPEPDLFWRGYYPAMKSLDIHPSRLKAMRQQVINLAVSMMARESWSNELRLFMYAKGVR